eukprot:scaffold2771_cov252-Pinguiococcus_pyrenoidosus.AAC.11
MFTYGPELRQQPILTMLSSGRRPMDLLPSSPHCMCRVGKFRCWSTPGVLISDRPPPVQQPPWTGGASVTERPSLPPSGRSGSDSLDTSGPVAVPRRSRRFRVGTERYRGSAGPDLVRQRGKHASAPERYRSLRKSGQTRTPFGTDGHTEQRSSNAEFPRKEQ